MKILESYSLVELDITTIKYIWTLLYIHFYHAPFLSDKFTFHSLEMGNYTNMFAWYRLDIDNDIKAGEPIEGGKW